MTRSASANPHHVRERYGHLIGKKVTVGTTTLHYLCGYFCAIEPPEAVFTVGKRLVRIPLSQLDSMSEAPAAQAEYVK
jgi:hypothetical protein